MKNLNLFLSAILLIAIMSSCTKDDPVDDRDKFVGTWKGTQTTIIPDLDLTDISELTQTIKKSTSDSKKIIIFNDASEEFTATVNGSAYVYDEHTSIETIEGETYVTKIKGTGSINDNVITENGTITDYMFGEEYVSTFTCNLIKQ